MIDEAEPHLECARNRIGLWRNGADARFRGHRGIVGERDGDRRVSRHGAKDLGGNVEHSVAPIRPRDGEDRLSRLHDLTRLGGSGGDCPRNVGSELGEAQPVLSDIELRGRVVDAGLRGLQRLLCRIENRPGGEASLHQVVLAIEIVLRLDLLAARGVERRLRRAHAIELVLRVELRQHLIRLDLVADPAFALDNASADAEGEVHFVFGADVPGEGDRVANLPLFDGDRADRTGQRRFGLGFLIAAGDEQRQRRGDDERASAVRAQADQGCTGPRRILPRVSAPVLIGRASRAQRSEASREQSHAIAPAPSFATERSRRVLFRRRCGQIPA